MERNCNTTLEIIFCGVVPACIIIHSSQKINTGVLLAFQDKGNQHRETLAYYATFLSDVWNKPQKLSEWCGIRSSFWIMIHRKSMEAFIFYRYIKKILLCILDEKLGLEYLDSYLNHWPAVARWHDDWREINRSTWRAFEEPYREGRIKPLASAISLFIMCKRFPRTATSSPW